MGYLDCTTQKIFKNDTAKKHQKKSKEIAVDQFLKLFKIYKNSEAENSSELYYGFEQESYIVRKQEEEEGKLNYVLNNEASYIFSTDYDQEKCKLITEGLSSQFEVTPPAPYNTLLDGREMFIGFRNAYEETRRNLQPRDEVFLSPTFPAFQSPESLERDGFGGMTPEEMSLINVNGSFCYSVDKAIAQHPRYFGGRENVKTRANSGTFMLPIFKDKNTDLTSSSLLEPTPGFIHMDRYIGGASVTSIQVTFSAVNLTEARYTHDQLHILAPFFVRNISQNFLIFLIDCSLSWNPNSKTQVDGL